MENRESEYIEQLVARARDAQQVIAHFSQEQVDAMTVRIAWAGVREENCAKIASLCAAETGMGNERDKYRKLQVKIKGALRDMKGRKSTGVVESDPATGIQKIAKPMGVIGAVLPVTNSEATPFLKIMWAIKTRNAIILSPHPRALKTNQLICGIICEVLQKNGWPQDLVINVDEVSLAATKALMAQSDLVLATGGAAMRKAAYSSGTPSQGVGAGNAVCIVDETADLKDSADKIMRSKTFDNATSCSTENEVLIQRTIYPQMVTELISAGGYLCSEEEKAQLEATMWTDKGLNPAIVGQGVDKIAGMASISPKPGTRFLMVEESGVGKEYPFSGEKLSVTMSLYAYDTFREAIELVNRITAYSGRGHSCGIHTTDPERIQDLGMEVQVSRIMVRQPQCLANSGAWTNGMPMTLTLGCGSWGGNSTTSNVTWEHLLNYTWISTPIPTTEPTDEELFGDLRYEEEIP